jgi:hypothetical protein
VQQLDILSEFGGLGGLFPIQSTPSSSSLALERRRRRFSTYPIDASAKLDDEIMMVRWTDGWMDGYWNESRILLLYTVPLAHKQPKKK